MRHVTLLLWLTASVAGCAGVSKQACLEADWRSIGYRDGVNGEPAATSTDPFLGCRDKTGGGPDMTAYLAGWRDGIEKFCTPANGFAAGSRGVAGDSVCGRVDGGAATGDPFFSAYQDGRRLFDLETAAVAADRRIGDAQSDIWTIKQRIAEVDMSLSAFDISSDERADLLAERRALVEERVRVERSLSTLVAEKQRADEALASYRTNLPEASGGAVRPSNASY